VDAVTVWLRRGLAAGLVAGLAAGVFHLVASEPVIERALTFEAAPPGGASAEVFSRGAQRLGLLAGVALYGAALGGVFGVLYAFVAPRMRSRSPWERSLRLAAATFASTWLIPFVKYPANPPGVGDPETVVRRAVLYLAMVGVSVAAWVGSWWVARRLRAAAVAPGARRTIVGAGYLAVILAAYALLPGVEGAGTLPAGLLWRARISSIGGQALLWTGIGVGFGLMCVRDERRPAVAAAPADGRLRE
jgi:hypothetical protein